MLFVTGVCLVLFFGCDVWCACNVRNSVGPLFGFRWWRKMTHGRRRARPLTLLQLSANRKPGRVCEPLCSWHAEAQAPIAVVAPQSEGVRAQLSDWLAGSLAAGSLEALAQVEGAVGQLN